MAFWQWNFDKFFQDFAVNLQWFWMDFKQFVDFNFWSSDAWHRVSKLSFGQKPERLKLFEFFLFKLVETMEIYPAKFCCCVVIGMNAFYGTLLWHRVVLGKWNWKTHISEYFWFGFKVETVVASHQHDDRFDYRSNRSAKLETDIFGIKRFLIDNLEGLSDDVIILVTLQEETFTWFAIFMCFNQSRTDFWKRLKYFVPFVDLSAKYKQMIKCQKLSMNIKLCTFRNKLLETGSSLDSLSNVRKFVTYFLSLR